MDAATLHPGDRFRCVTFGTRMMGADCASRHARVATKGDLPASVQCGTCPAGEARARLLGKVTPPAAAPKRRVGMFLAPREPMTDTRCIAADGTPRGALTAQAAAERVVVAVAREPDATPVFEVAEPAPTPRGIDRERRPAREHVAPPRPASKRPRTVATAYDWSTQPLGNLPDGTIATAMGVDRSTVRKARVRAGIPACPEGRAYRSAGVDWDAQPLGVVSDYAIAEACGVTPEAVRAQRKKRGIDAAPLATPTSTPCTRARCDGAVVPATQASSIDGVCATCRDEVRTKLRRQLGRTPTVAERVEWLATHPKGGTPTGRPRRAPDAERPANPRTTRPAPVAETPAARDDAQVSEAEAWAQAFAARCGVEAERAARETAAAGRLFDQLDAAWRECSELKQDLRAALNAGAKWRGIAETLAKLLTETMGVAADVLPVEVGRG